MVYSENDKEARQRVGDKVAAIAAEQSYEIAFDSLSLSPIGMTSAMAIAPS